MVLETRHETNRKMGTFPHFPVRFEIEFPTSFVIFFIASATIVEKMSNKRNPQNDLEEEKNEVHTIPSSLKKAKVSGGRSKVCDACIC